IFFRADAKGYGGGKAEGLVCSFPFVFCLQGSHVHGGQHYFFCGRRDVKETVSLYLWWVVSGQRHLAFQGVQYAQEKTKEYNSFHRKVQFEVRIRADLTAGHCRKTATDTDKGQTIITGFSH